MIVEPPIQAALALLLGALIGVERQLRNHEAGLKTNALVSLGAALFAGISLRFPEHDKVVAQIVTGIGFLGAGAIMRDGLHVRGLNTAATIWCSAAVGSLCGINAYIEASEAAVLVVGANIALRSLANRIDAAHARKSEDELGVKGQ